MKLRWKILIALGILLVLVAASLTLTMHVQPKNELEAYKKMLRAKGEKLELAEVLPPPAAPADNSVQAVENAFKRFGTNNENILNAMKMVAPGKAMVGWRQPDARGNDFTNSWAEFGAAVELDRPAIELLHQVLDRPKLDFNLDHNKGSLLPMTNLMSMRRASRKLATAAIWELRNGDGGAAATNILTMLALVNKSAVEGLLISHLARLAMTANAVTSTWELLQATNVTDAQLASVQKGWEQMNFLGDAEIAILVQRTWASALIQRSRGLHKGFMEVFGSVITTSSPGSSSGGSRDWSDRLEDLARVPRLAAGEAMWRASGSYADELRSLQVNEIALETVRAMQTNGSRFYKPDYDAMSSRLSALGFTNAGSALLDALKIPDFRDYIVDGGLDTAIRRTIQLEAARDVVVAAIALKRFEMEHARLPGTLADMTPQFLSSVPIDPYDGKPLKYRLKEDGTFLLYSVGDDGIDGGGDVAPAKPSLGGTSNWYWQRARDWVWPQPATPAEVQNYYEQPPE